MESSLSCWFCFCGVQVTAVGCTADGQFAVTAARDGTARVWSLEKSELVMQFQVVGQQCTSLTVHPDSDQCAIGYNNGLVRVFSLLQVELLIKCQPHNSAIQAMLFSSDGW